jgi:hypothetical protein
MIYFVFGFSCSANGVIEVTNHAVCDDPGFCFG